MKVFSKRASIYNSIQALFSKSGKWAFLKNILVWIVVLYTCPIANGQPVANFTGTPLAGCPPLIVQFTDQSTGNPTSWHWQLGNLATSSQQNPAATYFYPGVYTVTLTATNAQGSNTIVKTQYITVYDTPRVNINANIRTGCKPLLVNFSDITDPGSGTAVAWQWDFGDGNISTQQNPSHTYTASGTYNISLKVTNSFGCSKVRIFPAYIDVAQQSSVSFTNTTPANCVAPINVSFQSQCTGAGPFSYLWDFGDGGASTLQNPVHAYSGAGLYTVTLIVTNAHGCRDTLVKPGAVNIGNVNPAFTMPASACTSSPITIINNTTPVPASVFWNFGNGNTSTVLSPTVIYNTPGNYTVTLTSNFQGNCQTTTTHNVVIGDKPVVSFTADDTVACNPPHTVNFTTTGNATTYLWDFGDGGTSTSANPAHTYNSFGDFTVKLIVGNGSGCYDTIIKPAFINIHQPEATIAGLPALGCAPHTQSFNASINTADPIVSYQWNFGNGNTSTLANPVQTFAAGVYPISLIVATANGCVDTVQYAPGISVGSPVHANFSANPLIACAETPINFTNLSTGGTQWFWDFGDGSSSTQQNPIHEYSDTGYFTITLIVRDFGCVDSIQFQNYVYIKPPIAAFNKAFECANPYSYSFNDASLGADTWFWEFGDGATSVQQNPVHTYATTGQYIVRLTVTNTQTGCTHSKTDNVLIVDEHPDFTAQDFVVCRNTESKFWAINANPQNIIQYEWDFGDNSPVATGDTVSHFYTISGIYSVKMIATDISGCKDTIFKQHVIRIKGPDAAFDASDPSICLGTIAYFNDLSTSDGINPIIRWTWDFGDGNSQVYTAPPFSHNYTAQGLYNVSLIIEDSGGCFDTIVRPQYIVVANPVADFQSDTLSCFNTPIHFQNLSTGASLNYIWDFGDGNTSTLPNPVYSYANNGTYSVTLSVVDMYGCADTLVKPDIIRLVSPIADFEVSDHLALCPPLLATFTNTSVNYSGVLWDFGDGNSSTLANPSHYYVVSGTYIITLTVKGYGNVCTSVAKDTIIVKGPVGSFEYGPLEGCNPFVVNFIAHTNDDAEFIWDFRDGTVTISPDSIISYPYVLPGQYLPRLILRDTLGCTVSINGTDTITVHGLETSFSANTHLLCDIGVVNFQNTTTTSDPINSYLWNFGDGTTSSLQSPQHLYASPGIYQVSLIVSTVNCIDTFSMPQPVKVISAPQLNALPPAGGCIDFTNQFYGSIANPDTSAISWSWNFGNGQTSVIQNPNPITYTSAGTYNVSLIATNSSGCKDTVNTIVNAYPLPVVNAGTDVRICQGNAATLTASGANNYLWTGTALSCNNCSSTTASPQHNALYTVLGTDINGCQDTDSISVSVVEPFNLAVSPNDTLCVGRNISLSASGTDNYNWVSLPAGVNYSGSSMSVSPTQTTTYIVTATDRYNCFTKVDSVNIKVYPIPIIHAGNDTTILSGQTLTIKPTISPDITKVTWTPISTIVSQSFPNVTVKPRETTTYHVKAYNDGMCQASDAVTIFVICNGENIFVPNTFSPNGDGMNDVFYPRGSGLFRIKSLKIFDRWGEMVYIKNDFNPNDANAGWNGTYKGKQLNVDVYVYVMEIICENSQILLQKGNVALVK